MTKSKFMQNFKKLGPKEFFKKWGEGFKKLPPLELAKSKRDGHAWAVIGGSVAVAYMAAFGLWYFIIFMSAVTYLQWIEYKKMLQQINGMKELQKQMGNNGNKRIF